MALAYLLGSDYSEGVRGVGIVNAMEIMQAFCGLNRNLDVDRKEQVSRGGVHERVTFVMNGLERFKGWLNESADFSNVRKRRKLKKNHHQKCVDESDVSDEEGEEGKGKEKEEAGGQVARGFSRKEGVDTDMHAHVSHFSNCTRMCG